MNKNKIIYGLLGVLAGCIIFILGLDVMSKPTNVGLSLNPIESLETYFFGFVWIMGSVGWVVGSIFLLGFLALLYFLGVWIYRKSHPNIK